MDVLIVEPLEPEVMHWLVARHAVRYAPDLARDPRAFRQSLFNVRSLIIPPSVSMDSQALHYAPVLRAVGQSRARGRNGLFEDLSLPEETRNYVPRLLALRNIVAEPERFGLDLGVDFSPVERVLQVGSAKGVAPGYKGSLGWRKLELYSEGEYVFDTGDRSASFFYSWS